MLLDARGIAQLRYCTNFISLLLWRQQLLYFSSAIMVGLEQIQSSNTNIAAAYPAGLVAVFAGATAGIGESSLREFARHTVRPRIYIIGRSQEACIRLDAELKELNPDGTYTFLRSDTSLLRNVDDVCLQIKQKEEAINVLFMSQGTANWNKGRYYMSLLEPL